MFIILCKNWKKLASSSINQSVKSEKQCVHPKICLLWQKVYVKRHQHQFTVVLNNWTFRRHHWDEFCIKIVGWRQSSIGSGVEANWSSNAFSPAIDLQKMPILAKKIISSDEAHFDLGGYVNKQNCRYWGTENPHAYIEKSTHPKRVIVWCGFRSKGIIGPLFFENEQVEAVTVNDDRYWAMLNVFLFTKIE